MASCIEQLQWQREKMEKHFQQKMNEKDTYIDDLRNQLERKSRDKDECDEQVKQLQREMSTMARHHSEQLMESQKSMADMVKDKDEKTERMANVMLSQLMASLKNANEMNGRQLNQVASLSEKKEDLIKINQLLLIENAHLKNWKSVGCSIMSMVNEQRNDIVRKYDFNFRPPTSDVPSTGINSNTVGNQLDLIN